MKKFFCIFFLILFASQLFAQVTSIPERIEPGTFFFTTGPNILFNFDKSYQSAPSPIMYSGGFGGHIPLMEILDFSPHVSFFTNYYLLSDNVAYPAEIENRTVLAPSFMIDLPINVKLPVYNSIASVGLGLSIFARYGFLATGVPDSAASEVEKINSYFWSGVRWLYPMAQAGWDYVLPNGMAAGLLVRGYLPLGSLIDPNPSMFQSAILSITLRFHLSTRLF